MADEGRNIALSIFETCKDLESAGFTRQEALSLVGLAMSMRNRR